MKRCLIFLLLISFCGGDSEISSDSFPVTEISTTTPTFSSTTTTLQESDTPFNTYWRNNKLKSYAQLTESELELSNQINSDKISYLVLADGTECIKKIGGTSTVARIDEFDLVNPKGSNEWGFIVSEEYTCDDEKRPGRLYGELFLSRQYMVGLC